MPEVEHEIPPHDTGRQEGACGALGHERNPLQLIAISSQLAGERKFQRVGQNGKFLEALEQASRLVALHQRRLGSV